MPLCECVCECVCDCDLITNRKECVYSLQSEEGTNHTNDALSCRSLSAKQPLIIVAINRGVRECDYITHRERVRLLTTERRRGIGCLGLQVSFRKRATNYRALLRTSRSCLCVQVYVNVFATATSSRTEKSASTHFRVNKVQIIQMMP